MKKTILSNISLLLAILMLCGVLAACKGGKQNVTTSPPSSESTEESLNTTESTSSSTTEPQSSSSTTESPSSSSTESPSSSTTEAPSQDATNESTTEKSEQSTEDSSEAATDEVIEGPHYELITTASSLTNNVNGGFTNGRWREFDISNNTTSIRYILSRDRAQGVAYIKNSQGASYLENTMDVFVRMTDGYVAYASNSTEDSIVNIYNFGQYYYDFRFQGQNFANGLEITDAVDVPLGYVTANDLSTPQITDGVLSFYVKKKNDPYLVVSRSLDIDGTKATHIQLTMKVDYADTMAIYLIADDMTGFSPSAKFEFETIPDGEFHTYLIPISSYNKITGLRIDPDSFKLKEEIFAISEIKFVNARENGISDIKLENVFHTYSDKIHQEIHIATYNEVTNVAEVGIKTEIAANTVSKLIVKDKNGAHDTLDGIDWSSVECIGFDVTEAGIIGFIVPDHETSGTVNVTLEGDNYVIIYSRAPENNTLYAVEGTPASKAGTVYGNDKDFIMGQRIYTEECHSFDGLLLQSEIERNPLGSKNIKVSAAYSANASFLGYDAIRGCYEFWVGYNKMSVEYPNRMFNLNFTIKSDDYDRLCYVVAGNDQGASPWGVLLDENLMQIPVDVQLWKNFTDGDETLFNVLDGRYQEAIVPIISSTEETNTYNLLSVYFNWGNYPVKQLSSIQYGAPYYHVVTGLVETNCMVPWRYTQQPNVPNRLPDHRPMSAPEWPGGIQHSQAGCHSFNDSVEVEKQIIHSYGPSYIDLEMVYSNDDYSITYHHIEMPQTDENRTYYTIEYVFDKDTTFTDFKNTFSFYSVSSFESTVDFRQFGYLDENGNSQLGKFEELPENIVFYTLGDKPYVSLFDLDHLNYCNVSFLVYDYNVVIEGQETDVDLVGKFNRSGGSVALTFDIGDITFHAGDTISIDLILVPWGSEQSDYSGTVYAPDQNVRDLRENTLLNPIRLTPEADCELVESTFVPMAKSTNGQSATFTISGGKVSEYTIPYRDGGYNVGVRIYGFNKLGVPVVEQLVNGEWVPYELCSANNLDKGGHGAYFDGYGVQYDADGTYSYNFVVNMDDATAKTFRISLMENFEKFPWILVDDATLVTETPFNVYKDVNGVAESVSKSWFGKITVAEENGISFVSLYAHPTYNESQVARALQNTDGTVTGQYVFFKYRLPSTNKQQDGVVIDFFTSTVNTKAVAGDGFALDDEIFSDGEWHVIVVDVSTFGKDTIIPNDDGTYTLQHIRLDPINGINDTSHRIDIAYFAVHDNFDEILEFNKTAGEDEVLLVTGSGSQFYSTSGDIIESKPDDNESTESNVSLNVHSDSTQFANSLAKGWFSNIETGEENGMGFVSLYAHSTQVQSQIARAFQNADGKVTGQYVFFKYRLPSDNNQKDGVVISFFTSTVNEKAVAGDGFGFEDEVMSDGQWHVIVVDVSTFGKSTIIPESDGTYILKHVRLDPINGINDTSHRIDFAFFAIHDDIDEILAFCKEAGDTEIILATGDGSKRLDTATGDVIGTIGGDTSEEETTTPSIPDAAESLNIYMSVETLSMPVFNGWFSRITSSSEDGVDYVSLFSNPNKAESQMAIFSNPDANATGQYLFLKYRLPVDNPQNSETILQFFTSTVSDKAKAGESYEIVDEVIADGQWHVVVLDIASFGKNSVSVNENGEYCLKYVRFDPINGISNAEYRIDVAYVAIHDNIDEIIDFCNELGDEEITLITAGVAETVPTSR